MLLYVSPSPTSYRNCKPSSVCTLVSDQLQKPFVRYTNLHHGMCGSSTSSSLSAYKSRYTVGHRPDDGKPWNGHEGHEPLPSTDFLRPLYTGPSRGGFPTLRCPSFRGHPSRSFIPQWLSVLQAIWSNFESYVGDLVSSTVPSVRILWRSGTHA